jgi:hypothetical protein
MNETEARELWEHVDDRDRQEIAYFAYIERFMRDTHKGNEDLVRRGVVGAGVLTESTINDARARSELHASLDRAIERAKAKRDEANPIDPEANAQMGGNRSDLQTSATDTDSER